MITFRNMDESVAGVAKAAEILRAMAAAAEAICPSPWSVSGGSGAGPVEVEAYDPGPWTCVVASTDQVGLDETGPGPIAPFLATMSPHVASVLAEWLAQEATGMPDGHAVSLAILVLSAQKVEA